MAKNRETTIVARVTTKLSGPRAAAIAGCALLCWAASAAPAGAEGFGGPVCKLERPYMAGPGGSSGRSPGPVWPRFGPWPSPILSSCADDTEWPWRCAASVAVPGTDLPPRAGNDVILLDNASWPVFSLMRGDDIIWGNDVDHQRVPDTLCTGRDDDELHGRRGDDILVAGAGADRTDGGPGNDRALDAYDDDHNFYYTQDDWRQDNDVHEGGEGSDYILSMAGRDEVYGGPGNDWLVNDNDYGYGPPKLFDGGPGLDVCGLADEIRNCEYTLPPAP